jgi:hypothetical protein
LNCKKIVFIKEVNMIKRIVSPIGLTLLGFMFLIGSIALACTEVHTIWVIVLLGLGIAFLNSSMAHE